MRHIQQARTKARDSKTGVEPAWLQEIGLPKLPPKKLPKPIENTDDVAPTAHKRRNSKGKNEKSNVKDKTKDLKEKTSDSDNEDAKPSQETVYAQQELLYKFDFNLEN